MSENYIFTGEPETKTYNPDEVEFCYGPKTVDESPSALELKDMPRLIDAIDNLIHAVNNLSVVTKEKGNKYGY